MRIRQKPLVEIEGKQYMSPKAAAGLWGLSTQKVVVECKKGKILGACKDSKDAWIIPIDAKKPVSDEDIRSFLVALLAIKNKPGTGVENEKTIRAVLEYLEKLDYIEPIEDVNSMDLSSIVLSGKGMEVATSGKKTVINWASAGIELLQIAGSIASIAALL